MQTFEQFLWPPTTQGGNTSPGVRSGDSDAEDEDAQHVEQLVNPAPADGQDDVHMLDQTYGLFQASAAPMQTEPPLSGHLPTIVLNNIPVPLQPDALAINTPPVRAGTPSSSRQRTSSPRGSQRNTPRQSPERNISQRTPSPRGSKRNSPRQSPERNIRDEGTPHGSIGSKIRLVNVHDLQQETLMADLRQLLVQSNNLLERVEKDISEVKQNAAATKELAETAEKRAINAEKSMETARLHNEQRLQQIQKDIQAEASKQIHEAEKRTEAMLKSLKNMEQAVRPQRNENSASQAPENAMVVDQERLDNGAVDKGKKRAAENLSSHENVPVPHIPPPPRFPRPQSSTTAQPSSSLSTPLSFKRPKSKGKVMAVPFLNNKFLHPGETDDDSSSASEGDEAPRQKLKANVADLNAHEFLNLLLRAAGFDIANIGSVNKSGRRRAHRDFKEPAKRLPKQRGKQELMNWLRQHLHLLLDIKKSRDILKFATELYSSHTPLQRRMEIWEKSQEGEAPKLKPMEVNWNNFDGQWNIYLCELFVQYCASEGLEGGNPSDEVKEFVAEYFWDRLERLRGIIKKNCPKADETLDQTSNRTGGEHLQALNVARRNSRRNQKHHDRLDICLENLPEDVDTIITDEQRHWKKKYDLVMALGPEGMSSDETDESDSGIYLVRTLPWRSKTATQTIVSVDDAKNTTNGYGNIRPGNRPRKRLRPKKPLLSARKAPIGKPKNVYDRDWYEALNAGKKRALQVKADIDYD